MAGRRGIGLVLLAAGGLMGLLPPVGGLPIWAYLCVAALLVGGIACVPDGVSLLLRLLPARLVHLDASLLLAVERARRMRHAATIAIAGVVASLSLAVALTVMVASFRSSVSQWLDTVLPADLYVRTAISTTAGDSAFLSPGFVSAVRALPQVERVDTLRVTSLSLDPTRPNVALIARTLDEPERALPLSGELLPPRPGVVSSYVSEAMRRPVRRAARQRARAALEWRADLAVDPCARRVARLCAAAWRGGARQLGLRACQRRRPHQRPGPVAEAWKRRERSAGARSAASRRSPS